jgi:hypothetical protein
MELADKSHLLTAQIMEDLHKDWAPHTGQIQAGRKLFVEDVRNIFIQCGRKWGKSEFCIYSLWRWALLNPGSACYYLAPQQKQAKEIIWAANRIQDFGPKKYIKKIDNTELRIRFSNGSFIKVDGSDNYESYRGITPDFVVYDEFKDFNPKFHEGMEPNRAVKNAPLVIIGTPPDRECQYTILADEYKKRSDSYWIRMDSYTNPHNTKHWLDTEKEKLMARGELDVWEREYEARFIRGGAGSIFPMINEKRHFRPHDEITKELKRDLKKLEWYCITDPGTTTCFAALFAAINPYTKKMYILDEIYEKDQSLTSVRTIYPKLDSKMGEFYPTGDIDEDWFKVYDEAAAWFATEVIHQYGTSFFPTQKHLNKKEHGLSIIKDILLHDLVHISDRCRNLLWEMENYVKDDKGNIPKKDDHLIDCFRYLVAAANYNMLEVLEIIKQRNDYDRRAYSLREEADSWYHDNDWTKSFTKHWDLGE